MLTWVVEVLKITTSLHRFQRNPPPPKKSKTGEDDTSKTDDKGQKYWELDRNRRVSVSEFKGRQYLNIREYYQDKSSGKISHCKALNSCNCNP